MPHNIQFCHPFIEKHIHNGCYPKGYLVEHFLFSALCSQYLVCHFLSYWLKMFIHNPNLFFYCVCFFLNILLIKQLLSSNYHTRSNFDNRKKMVGKAKKKKKEKKSAMLISAAIFQQLHPHSKPPTQIRFTKGYTTTNCLHTI